MIKAIFFDVGGVLFLNKNGRGVLNEAVVQFMRQSGDKYLYGLLSSTNLELQPTLDEFNLQSYFGLIQTSGAVGIEKDDPRFFNLAVEALDISSNQAVMVDNDQDFLRAAGSAGLRTIYYTPKTDLFGEVESLQSL